MAKRDFKVTASTAVKSFLEFHQWRQRDAARLNAFCKLEWHGFFSRTRPKLKQVAHKGLKLPSSLSCCSFEALKVKSPIFEIRPDRRTDEPMNERTNKMVSMKTEWWWV